MALRDNEQIMEALERLNERADVTEKDEAICSAVQRIFDLDHDDAHELMWCVCVGVAGGQLPVALAKLVLTGFLYGTELGEVRALMALETTVPDAPPADLA